MNTRDWVNCKPEDFILYRYLVNLINANTITEKLYFGAIGAAGELLIYDASILYFGLRVQTNVTASGASPAGIISLYDTANAVYNTAPYNLGADFYKPIWFSRITYTAVVFTHLSFIGYKLQLV